MDEDKSNFVPLTGAGEPVPSRSGQPELELLKWVCPFVAPPTVWVNIGLGKSGPELESVCFISPVISIKDGITSELSIACGDTDFLLNKKKVNECYRSCFLNNKIVWIYDTIGRKLTSYYLLYDDY